MGKHERSKHSSISIENNHPGSMWDILHILKHNHWISVRKRLPHRRRESNKPANGEQPGNDEIATNVENMSANIDGKINESVKTTQSNSMKSWIKARISEELSKRRGRHRRSSTYPIRSQLERTDCFHYLELPFDDPLSDINGSSDDKSESSSSPEIEFHEGMDSRQQVLLKQTSKELNTSASFHQSKDLLDALDIMNMNKEFFLKVLQDPTSPLAHHFCNQTTTRSNLGYTKSVSFPSPASSEREGTSGSKVSDGKLEDQNYRGDVIHKFNQAMAEIDNASSSSSHIPKRNRRAIKRFRDLKQKITHAIKECKYEKHRISMDAVLHKIPHRHGFSKDLKKDILENSSMLVDGKTSPGNSCRSEKRPSITRTLSLKESLDRYCQLYDSTFNREASHATSGMEVKTQTSPPISAYKSLGRIRSSPELKYFFNQPLGGCDALSLNAPAKVVVDQCTGSNFDEQSILYPPDSSVNDLQLNTLEQKETQEKSADASSEDLYDAEQDIGASRKCISEVAEPSVLNLKFYSTTDNRIIEDLPESRIFSNEDHQEDCFMDTLTVDQREVDINKVEEFPRKNLNTNELNANVDAKDKSTFDYVREILELSGFSVNESLGAWYSDDQPVDPSLFEELEGCAILGPHCSGNEEGGNCRHLLLFDLINEILMGIYERSYSYCPVPLSSLSHIHPMPVGHHVLAQAWGNISWFLSLKPDDVDRSLDHAVTRDLAKDDGWLNLQFDAECVGLDLEDLIFDDLLEELIYA